MKKISCLIGAIALLIGAIWFVNFNRPAKILFLANDNLEVGIMPNAGGRIVIFKTHDGENILKEIPELWKKRHIPEPALGAPDVRLMGHMMWVSPQKEWWGQQNLIEDKRIKKADWPADPFTIYAHYQILEHSRTRLIMKAPVSPLTGLEMIKSFSINSNSLTLTTTAINRRDSEVKWGLWSNTRLNAKDPVSIPITSTNDLIKFELGYQSTGIYMPYIITNDTFVYDYRFDERDFSQSKLATKLYMKPTVKEYSTTIGDLVFSKRAITDINNVHSNQAPVELYIEFDAQGWNLMEQEFHSDYKTLQPSESMTFEEVWNLEYKR